VFSINHQLFAMVFLEQHQKLTLINGSLEGIPERMLQNYWAVYIFPNFPDFKLSQRFNVDAVLAFGSVRRVDIAALPTFRRYTLKYFIST
jgi:hypothetical protein